MTNDSWLPSFQTRLVPLKKLKDVEPISETKFLDVSLVLYGQNLCPFHPRFADIDQASGTVAKRDVAVERTCHSKFTIYGVTRVLLIDSTCPSPTGRSRTEEFLVRSWERRARSPSPIVQALLCGWSRGQPKYREVQLSEKKTTSFQKWDIYMRAHQAHGPWLNG